MIDGRIRTSVLLADDHKPLLDSIVNLLEPQFEVRGAICDSMRLLDEVQRLEPDVVVLDMAMPGMDGIEATKLLKANTDVAIVILTSYQDEQLLLESLKAGAICYVVKSRTVEDLATAIESAAQGRQFISPPLSGSLVEMG